MCTMNKWHPEEKHPGATFLCGKRAASSAHAALNLTHGAALLQGEVMNAGRIFFCLLGFSFCRLGCMGKPAGGGAGSFLKIKTEVKK